MLQSAQYDLASGLQDSIAALFTTTSAALWFSHELGGPHVSFFSLHKLDARDRQSSAATIPVPVADKMAHGFVLHGWVREAVHGHYWRARSFAPVAARTSSRARAAALDWRLSLSTSSSPRLLCARPQSPASTCGTGPRSGLMAASESSRRVARRQSRTRGVIEMTPLTPRVERLLFKLHVLKASVLPPKRRKSQTVPTEFSAEIAAYTLQGFTLNEPNYTGSTGFRDFYVYALVGRCCTLDVEDVKASVDHLVKEGKVIGQHPHVQRRCAAQPDDHITTIEHRHPRMLYPSSPIAHVRSGSAPVLFLPVTEDYRVVNVQGNAFFHGLRALGREVELLALKERDILLMGSRGLGLGAMLLLTGMGGRRRKRVAETKAIVVSD
ncbi:hypothetical protein EI94DRAFT_1701818 [Lactarius quietus]|nr:hypothetical protein EI94DRAFT_1701818 [Lactarius quietus]